MARTDAKSLFMMAVMLTSTLMVPAGGSAGEHGDVVGRVNGEAITLDEIKEARHLLPADLQAAPLTDVAPILREAIIDMRLAAARARELGIDDDAEFKLRMKRLSEQVLERMLMAREIKAEVKDEEIKSRYEKIAAFYKENDELHARHILLTNEADARDIIAKLDEGGDFAALAKAHSVGPTAPAGGDLGWFMKGRTVAAFEAAAFALEVGAYTAEPVETPYGWHVIRLEERRKPTLPSFEAAREDLVRERSAEIIQALKATLRAEAEIERTPLTAETANPVATPGQNQ